MAAARISRLWADLGVGIFAGNDFALLGDADLAVHRAARLRNNGVIARSAAAADRAAATVKQPQPHMVAREHFDQADLGLVEFPAEVTKPPSLLLSE